MKKEGNKNLITSILSGWKRIFGGERETARKPLPFPADRFYTPQELEFLSESKQDSPIDQWAVALGKWAFEQGKDKQTSTKFAPVKWKDGKLSTWIDGKLAPDPKDRQIDRLLSLQDKGYDIPKKYMKVIDDFEGNRLVGKYFFARDDNSFCKVKAYEEGRLITEEPSVVIQKWDDDFNMKEEKEDLEEVQASFVFGIYSFLPVEESQKFQNSLSRQEEGKQLYEGLQSLLHKSYPSTLGGSFPMELRTLHKVDFPCGEVAPVSWSLDEGKGILIRALAKGENTPRDFSVYPNNAYKAESLLRSISSIVEKEKTQGLSRSLVNVLGTNLGEGKIFARSDNSVLMQARQGNVNAVVSTSDGTLVAFNLSSHQEVSLDDKEKERLMHVLLYEGKQEQNLLRKELSVPMMKEYVDSLADKGNAMSGDYELLPSGTKVSERYNAYYKAEEELHSLYHSAFSLCKEDKEELAASHKVAYQEFKKELEKMVSIYNSHPTEIDDAKLKKLEALDHIIKIEAKGQTIAKPIDYGKGENMVFSDDMEERLALMTSEEERYIEMIDKEGNTQSMEGAKESAKPLTQDSSQTEAATNERYVSAEENNKGRWHSPEVRQREAYQRYGEMMADKLSLQLTYDNMPWVRSDKQTPCDLGKKPYQGKDALMLALDLEKNGYSLPIYISREDVIKNGLKVRQDASPFPLVEGEKVRDVYNIEQTDFSVVRAKEYETLKVEGMERSRNEEANSLPLLLKQGAWKSSFAMDGKPSLASYSSKEDTIHLAPAERHGSKNDYFRDLGMGLIRSCRKEEARKTNFESLSREELISLVGSAILGQKNHFDATTPQQSAMWKERLRKDPDYAKQIISSASSASSAVMQRIDSLRRGGSQTLDMRSTTPVEVDVDGNGVVESQENLAPDQKQGSGEGQEQSDDVPRHEKKGMHR